MVAEKWGAELRGPEEAYVGSFFCYCLLVLANNGGPMFLYYYVVAETWGVSLQGAEETYWVAFMTGVINFVWVLGGFTLWFLLLITRDNLELMSLYGCILWRREGSVLGFLICLDTESMGGVGYSIVFSEN